MPRGACTFGIATQDKELRARFAGKPEYIERFMFFVVEEARKIMAELGFRKFEDMIGRSDMLCTKGQLEITKLKGWTFQQFSTSRTYRMAERLEKYTISRISWRPFRLEDS